MEKRLCVLGSLNIDMTISVPHFNQPGESLTGTALAIHTGGKGGNQAIAAARLGAQAALIGCLGSDANGKMYREVLESEGVEVSGVYTAESTPSGMAFIEVVPSGENRIAVAQGANDALDAALIRKAEGLIASCDVFMCQLENPQDVIVAGLRLASKHGCTIILDPAPARALEDDVLALCDYITPNETELEILTGMPVGTIEEAVCAARTLIARGARAVLHKRGAAGALLVTAEYSRMYAGFTVEAVDTTAAGDSFNAGLAVGLLCGEPLEQAIALANAVGALSTTKPGAQAAMPTREEASAFLKITE